jgi:hypothetical protein
MWADRWMDRQTDMSELAAAFCNCLNVPNRDTNVNLRHCEQILHKTSLLEQRTGV